MFGDQDQVDLALRGNPNDRVGVTVGAKTPRPTRFRIQTWWRRRELNPRPKQLPPGLLRACPGFWFSPGGSSRRDPLPPVTATVLPQGRDAPKVAIRSM